MNSKYNAALGAYEKIKSLEIDDLRIGIGTGSTSDIFTSSFLKELSSSIEKIYSSSDRTTDYIKRIGLTAEDAIPKDKSIDVYIDGADEVDKDLNLIKGGGGAHTREKMLADASKYFICIVDETKMVQHLGSFGIPIEIMSFGFENTINKLKNFATKIEVRNQRSETGNVIIDLKGVIIEEPEKLESQIKKVTGVIEVGIFAKNKPNLVIVGNDKTYKLIDSSIASTID